MATSTPIIPSKKSQDAFIEFYKSAQNSRNTTSSERRGFFEDVDRTYQREMVQTLEHLRAKAANAMGDANRFQDVTVPVVMPQVESAVTYQTSVFLTGQPLFGVVSSPEFADAAVQLQTVIDEQARVGGWQRELMLFFRDGFKYNFAPLEIEWCREVTYAVETNLETSPKEGVPTKVLWEGNKMKRLDPYNTFVDERVNPTEVYRRGEFAGYTELVSRIDLKAFIASLPSKIIGSITPAFESSSSVLVGSSHDALGYYIPSINPRSSNNEKNSGTDWMAWVGLSESRNRNIDYKNFYDLTTMYCRILPSEFDLRIPNGNTPQIFKLHIVNHSVVIFAELQTNAHNFLPILIGQPNEDGLGYQTKSFAENSKPFQEVTTAYMNSIMASRRRAVSDRALYDPSRVARADINSANPSAKIPVRPAAYGKPLSEAVYQFPYREDQAGNSMQQIQSLLGMANHLNGQNRVSQGQFQKGNKTLQEFETVMDNSNGRDQMAAILLEHQVFSPAKHIIKTNVLQYQGGTSIYDENTRQVVEVDPIVLRKAVLKFKVSDGLIPSSKLMNAETFSTALQVIGSSPQITGSYNMGPMFSYLMKMQGADIEAFEKTPEQVAYEQALASWQQTVIMIVEKTKEGTPQLPPQPLPQQFNFDPASTQPRPEGTDSLTPTQQPTVLQSMIPQQGQQQPQGQYDGNPTP